MGPNLLYFAGISKKAEEMVSLLLDAGADSSAKWIYSYEWDAEDCYMSVYDTSLIHSLEKIYAGNTRYHDLLFKERLKKEQLYLLRKHRIIDANNDLHVRGGNIQVLTLLKQS